MRWIRGIGLVVASCSAWGLVEAGDVVVDGLLVSNGGSVKFADGSEQSSAAHPRWQRVAYVDFHGDGDYTNPAAAMADLESWCPGASTLAPCLLKVLPGDYDVGDTPMVMHPGVDLEGSGRNTTFVRGTIAGISTGLIVLSSFSEVRSLTLINNAAGAGNAVGIYSGSGDPTVDDVQVIVSGASAIGIQIYGGTPTIRRTEIRATGGESCFGIWGSDAGPLMDQVEVSTYAPSAASVWNHSIYMWGSAAPRLRQVRVHAEGGDEVSGISTGTSQASIENSTVWAASTGASSIVVGITVWSGHFHLSDCRVEAYPSSTWTWCSRASSAKGTSPSPGSRVPSRVTRDTPRQTPSGFSTVMR